MSAESLDPQSLAVGPAGPGDAIVIAALERASFADPWPEESVRAEVGFPSSLVLVARSAAGATPEGYAIFRRGYEEAELLRLGVRPERRRGGIGQALLAHGLALLRAEGIPLCHLEVRSRNAPALALYGRLGFVRTGLRAGYYRDGDDAVLMQLGLAPQGPGAGGNAP